MAKKKEFTAFDADVANFISENESESIPVISAKDIAKKIKDAKEKPSEKLTLYFTKEQMERLEIVCRGTGTSKNKFCVNLVMDALVQKKYVDIYDQMSAVLIQKEKK